MSKPKLLIVEDDPNLGQILTEYLALKGFETQLRVDGEEGLKAFYEDKFDLCVLDLMMPKKDGFTLAKEIRQVNTDIPIVFLTAKSMKQDIIQGFEIGADDYITKPFSMEELLARINAVLRRTTIDNEKLERTSFDLGQYHFDYTKRLLVRDSVEQKLTSKENDLLRLLCLNEGKVLERTHALKAIWDDDNYFNARSMDVYIAKLRKHLKEDDSIEIMNVHGRGFRFVVHK